jgi:tetratricopeptide (TPR) repeat protein
MKPVRVALVAAGLVAAMAQPRAQSQTSSGAPQNQPARPTQSASATRTAEAYQQFLLAQRLENDDDTDGAIAAYRRAMELDPNAADLAAELAGLYMRESRAQDAISTAEAALKIDPDNAGAHEVLGTIYASLASQGDNGNAPGGRAAQRENIAKAIDHLERAVDQAEGLADANTRAMLSRLYLSNGDYDKAIPMLAELVKQEPNWQDGAVLLSQAYSAAGRTSDAVAFLEEASQENPQLLSTLGDLYGRQDRWKEAADAYARALLVAPRSVDLRIGYGSALLNAGGADNAQKARDVLRDAVAARGTDQRALFLLSEAERMSGDFDAAEGTARRLVAQNRNSPRAYVVLAETLEERQRYQQVIDALGPAVNDFRASPNADAALGTLLPHLGFAYQQLGKYDRAIEALDEAHKLLPDDGAVTTYLIQANIAAKKYTAAAALAHEARIARPEDLRLARLEASALRQSGKPDQGIAVLQDIVQKHADDPAAYIALAQGYTDANKGSQAVKVLLDAQTRFPSEPLVTFELGATYDRQKKYAEAEAAFRQLIDKDAQNAAALNYLGYMFAERGEHLDESVALLQRALKIEPNNASYIDSLGWAYYKQGKYDEALGQLQRASDQLMTNSVVQDHYGDVLFKLSRYDDAIAAWNRALQGDGESIDRGAIDKKIRSARQKLPRR